MGRTASSSSLTCCVWLGSGCWWSGTARPSTAGRWSRSSWRQRGVRSGWRHCPDTPRTLTPGTKAAGTTSRTCRWRNVVCRDLEELHEQFHLAVGRLRQKPHLIRSFFAQAGLVIGKT